MRDTDIRPNLPKRCKICDLGLLNSMEQLVECCPFCFRTIYCEPNQKVMIQSKGNDSI